MSRGARVTAAALLALGLSSPAPAFIKATLSSTDATPTRWDLEETLQPLGSVESGEIIYVIDISGSDDIPGADELAAVSRAFGHWEGVGSSKVAFKKGADQAIQVANNDGINAIYWAEDVRTIIGGTQTNVSTFVSITPVFKVTAGAAKGMILDANIVLNGRQETWTMNPEAVPDSWDIEGVLTHEIGHFIGLDHSPALASAMGPRFLPGEARQRQLDPDDLAGATALYPEPGFASWGGIEGLVGRPAPVFGALVHVLDGSGRLIQSSITGTNGAYSAPGLPDGDYDVYVEPIDRAPAATTNLFDELDLGGIYGATVDPNFLPSLPVATSVAAPAMTPRSFTVGSTPGTAHLTKILERSPSVLQQEWTNAPTFVVQGDNNILLGVAGPNVDADSVVEITGPGFTQTSLTPVDTGSVEGEPYIIHSYNVALGAPIGIRSIRVTGPLGRSYASGAIKVYPNLPMSLAAPGVFNAVPGEVNNGRLPGQNPVTLELVGDDVVLNWDDEPAAYGYHVYRGDLASLLSTGLYNHQMIPGDVNSPCAVSTSHTVLPGEALAPGVSYYLVTAYNNFGEGIMGRDSSNVLLPPAAPACPQP
ncbi:MAG TPA: matrixin family metalloprotease [Candidatus Polarisedimenticolia bacterium]|nr:matrixin family metalloprotease [Candidatus Polarisedimenticolia bacterium]